MAISEGGANPSLRVWSLYPGVGNSEVLVPFVTSSQELIFWTFQRLADLHLLNPSATLDVFPQLHLHLRAVVSSPPPSNPPNLWQVQTLGAGAGQSTLSLRASSPFKESEPPSLPGLSPLKCTVHSKVRNTGPSWSLTIGSGGH